LTLRGARVLLTGATGGNRPRHRPRPARRRRRPRAHRAPRGDASTRYPPNWARRRSPPTSPVPRLPTSCSNERQGRRARRERGTARRRPADGFQHRRPDATSRSTCARRSSWPAPSCPPCSNAAADTSSSSAPSRVSPLTRRFDLQRNEFGLRGFSDGLRQDLHGSGVGVRWSCRGSSATQACSSNPACRLPPGVRTTTPERVAARVVRAIRRDVGEIVAAPLEIRIAPSSVTGQHSRQSQRMAGAAEISAAHRGTRELIGAQRRRAHRDTPRTHV